MLQRAGTVYREKNGRNVPVMQLSISLSFYYDGLESREAREAVIALLEEYAAEMRGRIRWTTNPRTDRYKKIQDLRDYLHPEEWLPELHPLDSWGLLYKGGEKAGDASDVLFEVYGGPADTPSHPEESDGRSLSSVYMHFPVTYMEKPPSFFPALFSKWAAMLPPYHGRAGFSYVVADGWFSYDEIQLTETQLLFSHPGLNYTPVGEEHYHGGGLSDGPKCADWMIFLSEKFVNALGGQNRIQAAMPPRTVIEYPGGLLLQAGEYPQLGEARPGWTLPEYQHLAAVIEPVRAKNLHPYMYEPQEKKFGVEAVCSRAMMESWCTRFAPDAIYPNY